MARVVSARRLLILVGFALLSAVVHGPVVQAMSADSMMQMISDSGWSFTIDTTQFRDYTLAEFTGMNNDTAAVEFPDDCPGIPDTLSLPNSYYMSSLNDTLPPIRNQGQCGSCWAFGTTGAIECALFRKYNSNMDFSEQWLIDYNIDGWNCETGGQAAYGYYHGCGYEDVCGRTGALMESQWPYAAEEQDTSDCSLSRSYYLSSYGPVPNNVDSIKAAIVAYGAVSCKLKADWWFIMYRGGIFDRMEPADNWAWHMVVLIGWDDNQGENGVWRLRNSHGTTWGENGYMRIAYGAVSVGSGAFYPVVAENVDDDGDGVVSNSDNCVCGANSDQADFDDDGIGDVCDNCPYVSNPYPQTNLGGDPFGDDCSMSASWTAGCHQYPDSLAYASWTLLDNCLAWDPELLVGPGTPMDTTGPFQPKASPLCEDTLQLRSGGTDKMYYYQMDPDFAFPDDSLVIEFAVERDGPGIQYVTETSCAVRFFDGEKGNILWITDTDLKLWSAWATYGPSVSIANEAIHHYRIVVDDSGGIVVYADYDSVLSGATFSAREWFVDDAHIWWGDLSLNASGYSRWLYFRHNGFLESGAKFAASDADADGSLPNGFTLAQNYPNPFNPTTEIVYSLSTACEVKLEVFNTLGQKVATPFVGWRDVGVHTVSFDGSALASGVYLYRLSAGDTAETRKMMMIK